MPKLQLAALIAVCLALAGCASTRSAHDVAVDQMTFTPALMDKTKAEGVVELADNDEVVCRKEMPLGSHIAKWRCDTKANFERSSRANQQRLQERISQPKPRLGGG